MSRMATETRYQSGGFFRSVSAAKSRVLLVDYDGTVAPFTADRHRAVPYLKIPEFLRCIMSSCGTRLIVVSGRSPQEVVPLWLRLPDGLIQSLPQWIRACGGIQ